MIKKLGIVFFLLFSQLTLAANLPDFPFLVSVGNAEREVKPDNATIQLGAMAFDVDSALALTNVNIATSKIMEALKNHEVPVANVEASDIEKSTLRKRDSNYNTAEILGYEVSRTFTIELEDLSKYAELMSDLVAVNHVTSARTSFDIANRKEVEAELVLSAGKDARENAVNMAESLGTKILSVYAISQASNFSDFFATFGATSEQAYLKYENVSRPAIPVVFAPKSINVNQAINVVFRIE